MTTRPLRKYLQVHRVAPPRTGRKVEREVSGVGYVERNETRNIEDEGGTANCSDSMVMVAMVLPRGDVSTLRSPCAAGRNMYTNDA